MSSINKLIQVINESNPDSSCAHLIMSLFPAGSTLSVGRTLSQSYLSKSFHACLASDQWPQAEEIGYISLSCEERKGDEYWRSVGEFVLDRYNPRIKISTRDGFIDSLAALSLECKSNSILVVSLEVLKPAHSESSINLEILTADFFSLHNCSQEKLQVFRLKAYPEEN
ncbi:MAG: hypothetical protein WA154_03605 [Moraxellaceae bacterium]